MMKNRRGQTHKIYLVLSSCSPPAVHGVSGLGSCRCTAGRPWSLRRSGAEWGEIAPCGQRWVGMMAGLLIPSRKSPSRGSDAHCHPLAG